MIAHTTQADGNLQALRASLKAVFVSQGLDPATAANKALEQIYRMVQAQSNALSFKNAFWVMSTLIIFLVPLPFIMRRPPAGASRNRAEAAH